MLSMTQFEVLLTLLLCHVCMYFHENVHQCNVNFIINLFCKHATGGIALTIVLTNGQVLIDVHT